MAKFVLRIPDDLCEAIDADGDAGTPQSRNAKITNALAIAFAKPLAKVRKRKQKQEKPQLAEQKAA
jgi:hypothetical protein